MHYDLLYSYENDYEYLSGFFINQTGELLWLQ